MEQKQSMEYFTLYQKVMSKYSRLAGSGSPSFFLPEDASAQEAVVHSLTAPGDRVLVCENGIHGKAFAALVEKVGGVPVFYASDRHLTLPAEPLRNLLKKETGIRYAFIMHCEPYTGMLNDVQTLCPILKENGILTVVDSSAAIFGNPLDVRRARIDILLGHTGCLLSDGTQYPLITVSHEAFHRMNEPGIPGSLLCLRDWQKNRNFPYGIPEEDIAAFGAALDDLDSNKSHLARQIKVADAVRAALIAGGLSLYGKDGFSATFTAFRVPKETNAQKLLAVLPQELPVYNVSPLVESQMLCIRHTGINSTEDNMLAFLTALTQALPSLGFPLKGDILKAFRYHIADPRY